MGGRGVVCAASYEVRPFGVRSAMPMATARRLCPQAVILPVRMDHYVQISRNIREIFLSFTPVVEPLSLDEAFLDVRGCEGLFGSAPEIGRRIKIRIRTELNLVASVGVATNKFLAKLASDHGKPDGFVVLDAGEVAHFLHPLPVSRIWGIGAKGEKRLHALGIRTVGQLAALPENLLADRFGEFGRQMWRLAHGQDERKVVPDREAKSISTETTFDQDIADRHVLSAWLLDLVEQLGRRLRHAGLQAGRVELKVRSSEFRTFTHSTTLAEATDLTKILWQTAKELLERSLCRDILPVRLLGVGGSKLVRPGFIQGSLFDDDQRERHAALDRAVDAIRGQFGTGAIRRGLLVDDPNAPNENESRE
jgi:DNA polymerase-4